MGEKIMTYKILWNLPKVPHKRFNSRNFESKQTANNFLNYVIGQKPKTKKYLKIVKC
jgi:hypothetical protein